MQMKGASTELKTWTHCEQNAVFSGIYLNFGIILTAYTAKIPPNFPGKMRYNLKLYLLYLVRLITISRLKIIITRPY